MFFRKDKPAKAPVAQKQPAAAPDSAEASRGWFSGTRKRPAAGETATAAPAPPPPTRRKRRDGLAGFFSGLMTVGLVLAIVVGVGIGRAQKGFFEPGPLMADRTVIIERGASSEEIVESLMREGVIDHPSWFWAALLARDIQSKFTSDPAQNRRAKSGEYLFKARVSMNEVLDIISSGRSIEHTITIPEGLTSEQIVEKLKENDLLVGEVTSIPTEGALLPDTYRITRGTQRQALLDRMARQQRQMLNDIWNRRAKDLPLRSARELVILASIVEKETGRADERPRVASVFYNRLEKRMRLQSDPTIIYGLVGGKGTLGRGILRSEIERATPYNTYVINGLPPGPIANPGRAAMEATANPSRTKDLYFVADGTGGHAFAETLEQHNRNVARWRQIEASRGSQPQSPQPSQSPGALQPVPAAPGENRGSVTPQQGGNPLAAPGQALGFSAPARVNRGGDLVPQPLPQREAVGSVPRQP